MNNLFCCSSNTILSGFFRNKVLIPLKRNTDSLTWLDSNNQPYDFENFDYPDESTCGFINLQNLDDNIILKQPCNTHLEMTACEDNSGGSVDVALPFKEPECSFVLCMLNV